MIGKIIMFFTFPGAIINSVIKQILCKKLRVAIYDISYFDLESFSWNINHELPKKFKNQLLIVILPFITGSLLGIIMAFPGTLSIEDHGGWQILYLSTIWLGISTVVQSVPKVEYSQRMLKKLWERETGFFIKLLCTPFLAIIYIVNILTFFEVVALIYGSVVVHIPALILEGI